MEISIIDDSGKPLLDTLINPETRIPYQASQIYGICDDMVAHEPTMEDIELEIIEAVEGKRVVIYNKTFDWYFCHYPFKMLFP